ncbi:MAG: PIN domain-containing protein [Chloroflexota bacterium]
MGAVLLDTTVLIDLLRGRAGAVRRLRAVRAAGDRPFVCAINVEEVERGVLDAEADALARLLDGLSLAPLGRDEGTRAGRWRRAHAARGLTLSQGDCLIASAAASIGARLATGNPKDFPMPELVVEHWPVGS